MSGRVFPFVNGILQREKMLWWEAFLCCIIIQPFPPWQWHLHINQWNRFLRDVQAFWYFLHKMYTVSVHFSFQLCFFMISYATIELHNRDLCAPGLISQVKYVKPSAETHTTTSYKTRRLSILSIEMCDFWHDFSLPWLIKKCFKSRYCHQRYQFEGFYTFIWK